MPILRRVRTFERRAKKPEASLVSGLAGGTAHLPLQNACRRENGKAISAITRASLGDDIPIHALGAPACGVIEKRNVAYWHIVTSLRLRIWSLSGHGGYGGSCHWFGLVSNDPHQTWWLCATRTPMFTGPFLPLLNKTRECEALHLEAATFLPTPAPGFSDPAKATPRVP